jgi:hypothetical protein
VLANEGRRRPLPNILISYTHKHLPRSLGIFLEVKAFVIGSEVTNGIIYLGRNFLLIIYCVTICICDGIFSLVENGRSDVHTAVKKCALSAARVNLKRQRPLGENVCLFLGHSKTMSNYTWMVHVLEL